MPLAASPLLCSALIAFAAGPAEPVEAPRPAAGVLLRYRFTEGEQVSYRVDHESTFVAAKGQLVEKNASRIDTDQRFEVAAVDADGTATLRVVIDRARMQYAFNDEKPSVYDSREPELPAPIFAGVSRSVGKPLAEIRVRADGTVESAKPLLAADLAGGPAKTGLEGDGPGSLFIPFPNRPIAVAEEWSDTFVTRIAATRTLQREVTILRQYRLESFQAGVATVAVKTSPLTVVTEPGQLVQLIQRTSAGRVRFDARAGRILGRRVEIDNTEIGFAGGDSSCRATSTLNERLVTDDAKVSAR